VILAIFNDDIPRSALLSLAVGWVTNDAMLSFKPSIVVAATAALSLVLLAGCKISQSQPQPSPAPTPTITNQPPPPPATKTEDSGDTMAPNILAWDATAKEYHAKPGELSAPFAFSLTNIFSRPVVIYNTSTSCDCTVASLPSKPWTVPVGSSGDIQASIDLKDKVGIVTNSVIVYTSQGDRRLNLRVFVAEPNSK